MPSFLNICRVAFWGLWWSVVAALAVLTLGGFAARWHYYLEVACHFRVPYFWLLTLATAIPMVARRWKWAAVPTSLALLNLIVIAPLYFGGPQRASAGGTTRILSLNVDASNRNYPAVLQLIADAKPDIVVLIDVSLHWDVAMRQLLRDYPFNRVVSSPGGSGIAIYSRIEPERIDVLQMGLVARPLLVGTFRINDVPLTIIAAHTRSPRSPAALADRNAQFVELAELVKKTPGEVVLIGDLNSTSWSPDFSQLLAESKLLDTRRGWGVQPTWPVQVPAELPIAQIPIDHCLVTPGVAIRERRVERAVGSDHYPIVVDFSLK